LAILIISWIIIWMVTQTVLRSYFAARLQNLVWSNTASASVRFVSSLSAKSLLLLTIQNNLLNLVTLGFYWPFAAVATYRLRVQAVTVVVTGDMAHFTGSQQAAIDDATGIAAGDFFGFDIGL
jgi:uncharacterized membrane protein YjgN (DUF898 family)